MDDDGCPLTPDPARWSDEDYCDTDVCAEGVATRRYSTHWQGIKDRLALKARWKRACQRAAGPQGSAVVSRAASALSATGDIQVTARNLLNEKLPRLNSSPASTLRPIMSMFQVVEDGAVLFSFRANFAKSDSAIQLCDKSGCLSSDTPFRVSDSPSPIGAARLINGWRRTTGRTCWPKRARGLVLRRVV